MYTQWCSHDTCLEFPLITVYKLTHLCCPSSVVWYTIGLWLDTIGLWTDTNGLWLDTIGLWLDTIGLWLDTIGLWLDTIGLWLDTIGLWLDTIGLWLDTIGLWLDTIGLWLDTIGLWLGLWIKNGLMKATIEKGLITRVVNSFMFQSLNALVSIFVKTRFTAVVTRGVCCVCQGPAVRGDGAGGGLGQRVRLDPARRATRRLLLLSGDGHLVGPRVPLQWSVTVKPLCTTSWVV